MKNLIKYLLILSCLFTTINLNAQCCEAGQEGACCITESQHQAKNNAPIGVTGDHYHSKGGMMISYRYMFMPMEGNRAKNNEIANSTIFSDYQLAPQDMDMQMHMVGLMYAFNDNFTVALMGNYLQNEMNLISGMGMEHYHQTSGLGDVKLNGILGLSKNNNQSFHLNMGINIPVGAINKAEYVNHENPHGGHHLTKLPYPMQLGSGTWDAQFGATWLLYGTKISGGIQPIGTFRTGENDEGYRWGNQYELNTWLAYSLNNWLSFSIRAKGLQVDKMTGRDTELMPAMSPTTNPSNFGGQQIHGFVGGNVLMKEGITIGIEYGLPLYQNYEGIQMDQQNLLTAGIKYGLF